jgi:RHS repeat-associated protein
MPSTTYYWDEDDDNVCCEEDENGEITASYTHEPGLYGEVIAQKRGDEVRYFNFDGEGNTSELTDDDQNVTDTYEYSAFGEEVARTGTTENPFGYKGALGYYANLQTGDYVTSSRVYQPSIGRWLSQNESRTNTFVFQGNQPNNAQAGQIIITATTADPPGTWYGKCGAFQQLWNFTINGKPQNETGYLLQMITYCEEIRDCNGNDATDIGRSRNKCPNIIIADPGVHTPQYCMMLYEVWDVNADSSITPNITRRGSTYHDRWAKLYHPCSTIGVVRIRSFARYFPGPGGIPIQFVKNDPCAGSSALPSTGLPPWQWRPPFNTPKGGMISGDMAVKWDCCGLNCFDDCEERDTQEVIAPRQISPSEDVADQTDWPPFGPIQRRGSN